MKRKKRLSVGVTMHLERVPVKAGLIKPKEVCTAVTSALFRDWLAGLDGRLVLKKVLFQSVDRNQRGDILFIKFRATCVMPDGETLERVVFLRGGTVAILFLLDCRGMKFAVLAVEPRPACGLYDAPGLPAGMLDGSGDFAGVAAREIEEELGVKISKENLVSLLPRWSQTEWRGAYLSPGACDEFLQLYVHEQVCTEEELESYRGKLTGLREEGEKIALAVVPLSEVPARTPDAKALLAFGLYHHLIRSRK